MICLLNWPKYLNDNFPAHLAHHSLNIPWVDDTLYPNYPTLYVFN